MAIVFEKTNRLIIPRWRMYDAKNITPEHTFVINQVSTKDSSHPILDLKHNEWRSSPSLIHAWELVNSAYINNNYPVAKDAASYLKAHVKQLAPNLRLMISTILDDVWEPSASQPIAEMPLESLVAVTKQQISGVKRKIGYYLRNEYLWLELGRLYAITGDLNKAEKCIKIATHFSNKENRYFLRTVSRFYYHIGQFDTAQSIIRLSPMFKIDPWLLAIDISYSSKMGRHAVNAKKGIEILRAKSYTNESLSELAGVLGTLEFDNNDIRQARKFTRQSLLAPNDNSLAQAEWLSREITDIPIGPWMDKVTLGYEARAYEHYFNNLLQTSMQEAMRWVLDQPFSKRACHFASYLATALLDNHQLAIDVGELGACTNPDYFPIFNNLAYAYVSKGDFVAAEKALNRMKALAKTPKEHCYAFATEGYYQYRSGDILSGRESYILAIETAKRANFEELRILAEANHIRESWVAREINLATALERLETLKAKHKEFDTSAQIKQIHKILTGVCK